MSTRLSALFSAAFFLVIIAVPHAMRAADVPDEENDYQIPEGYEERRYPIVTLTNRPENFRMGDSSFAVSDVPALTEAQIIAIIRYCAAPESWTKRGPARIEYSGGHLTVIQKKEAHAEIEKVLQWLQESVAPPFRATIVTVSLKPDAIRKLAAAGTVPTVDLLKAIEDAGDGNAETIELRGIEGQQVAAQSGQQQSYINDYDVSGAVFDPVIKTMNQGLSASAAAYRNPDCASVQIDLGVRLSSKIDMAQAKMSLGGISSAKPAMTVKEVKKDDKGKPIDTPEQHVSGKQKSADVNAELTIELPTQTVGGLQTSLAAPQGAFVLAGTIDFSLANEQPGKVLAVFVRASVGAKSVPTLAGVSGLKDGETFRLYPLAAGARSVPNAPTVTGRDDFFPVGTIDLGTSSGRGTGAVNAFAGAPLPPLNMTPMNKLTETINKQQHIFAEKVRKNKLVEEMGPVLFTRLLDADHTKALKNLTDETQRQSTPMAVQAYALALPQAAYRKLLLADNAVFDPADVEALAGNGGQVLVDTGLSLVPWQKSTVFAGVHRNVVADYEISGDSYDPVIRQRLERWYALDLRCYRSTGGSGNELEVRFSAVPSKIAVDRVTLDTFTVNSGADTNVLLSLRADLDKIKNGAISLRSTANAPSGKYILAGSAQMPPLPDGKADTRQAVLFVRVGDGK